MSVYDNTIGFESPALDILDENNSAQYSGTCQNMLGSLKGACLFVSSLAVFIALSSAVLRGLVHHHQMRNKDRLLHLTYQKD